MKFSNLTDNQQFVACALTDQLQLRSEIKEQASADIGYLIKRVSVTRLLELGVAEGNEYMLKRGKNWHEYYEKHGGGAVILGLLASDIKDIFVPDVVTNVVPFQC